MTPQPSPVLIGALDTTEPVLQRADPYQWLTTHFSETKSPSSQRSFQRSGQRRLPATSFRPPPPPPRLQVGDFVYVKSDRDKSRARDRYIIVSIDGEWCFIKKFSGS